MDATAAIRTVIVFIWLLAVQVDPPRPAFAAAWPQRHQSGDVRVFAADGSSEPAHRLALQCRVPVLQGQPRGAASAPELRLQAIPNNATLAAWLEFVYTDDVQPSAITHQLHLAALKCRLERLVTLCEANFAGRLQQHAVLWAALSQQQRLALVDALLDWICYTDNLGRRELRDFCVHTVARFLDVARSR